MKEIDHFDFRFVGGFRMPNSYFLDLKDNQIVLFADILGFSNAILKSENVNWESNDIEGILIKLPVIYDMITKGDFSKEYQKRVGIKFLWVSDSIIISTDIFNFDKLMYTLCDLINKLYCLDFSIRGAICIGKFYHKENIWGTPYIKAVELEKNISKYPRIIISKTDFHSMKVSDIYKQYFQNTEIDEYLYFDYFECFFDMQVKENKNISNYLGTYSSFIIENFENCIKKEHQDKWRWLARELHNTIAKHSNYIQRMLDNSNIYSCFTGKRILDYNEYLKMLEKGANFQVV